VVRTPNCADPAIYPSLSLPSSLTVRFDIFFIIYPPFLPPSLPPSLPHSLPSSLPHRAVLVDFADLSFLRHLVRRGEGEGRSRFGGAEGAIREGRKVKGGKGWRLAKL